MLAELLDNVRRFGFEKVFKRYYSEYHGQVTDIEDPESRARIKVRVPELMGEFELPNFAIPIADGAGPEKGMFFEVQPGDWVLIRFDKGNLRAPKYRAGWWSRGEFPTEFSQEGKISGVKTRSGHTILFHDKAGEEKIEIKSKSGNVFTLSDVDKKIVLETPGGNKLELDDAANEVTLTSAGKITENVGGDWTVNVTGNAKIESGGNVEVISGGDTTIEAATIMEVKGTAQSKFGDSGSITEVNGTLVKLAQGSIPVAFQGSLVTGVAVIFPVVASVVLGQPKVLV